MTNDLVQDPAPEEVDYGAFLKAIEEAEDDDHVFDILKAEEPPPSKLDRMRVRSHLVKDLEARKMSSPAKIADAWLAQGGREDEPQGSPIEFEETEPWPSPVDGKTLLGDVADLLGRYTHTSPENLTAAALWVVHSHAADHYGVSPILQLASPVKRCGKTTMLMPIHRLARQSLLASNVTPAALFRSIEAWRPTMVIDEADTFLKLDEDFRGILNAGHTRDSAFVLRTAGDDNEPRVFSTWCPKVVAAIGHLPDTIEDRAIRLVLARKPTSVKKEDAFDSEAVKAACEPVRRRIIRWVADNASALASAGPPRPSGLGDREWNNWKPLLAIAQVAGELESGTKAAQLLSAASEETEYRVLTVMAFQEVPWQDGFIPSEDVLKDLVGRDNGPWAGWWSDRVDAGKFKGPAMKLARIMNDFGIEPKKVRVGEVTVRGYLRSDFTEVWATYAPASQKDGTAGTAGTPQVTATRDVPTGTTGRTFWGDRGDMGPGGNGQASRDEVDNFLDEMIGKEKGNG